jgi:transcription initiation factor IIE alpha subunit
MTKKEQSLSLREQIVLDLLPSGHKKAVHKRKLAELTGMSEREVREIIYNLVVNRGLPIGSCTEPHSGGYFLIQDLADLEVATRHLKPRAKAIFRRARVLEKIARDKFGRQLRLMAE